MYTVFLSFFVFSNTWLLTFLFKFLNMLLERLFKNNCKKYIIFSGPSKVLDILSLMWDHRIIPMYHT